MEVMAVSRAGHASLLQWSARLPRVLEAIWRE